MTNSVPQASTQEPKPTASQGEGHFIGTPAIFVRLQGCPVGCPWCDTKHTWTEDPPLLSTDAMLAKPPGSDGAAWMEASELATHAVRQRPAHVVITGGEPALQPLGPLTLALEQAFKRAQIETSGCYSLSGVGADVWVTVAPKIGMPGGASLNLTTLARADEIKMPVGKARDIALLREQVLPHTRAPLVWLQPLSLSPSATRLCVEAATEHGWRVSLQAHRLAGLR